MKISLSLIFSFFLASQLHAQSTILKGSVIDNAKKSPLTGVSVVLIDSLNSTILKYTFTDLEGSFLLETDTEGPVNLVFSSLGFESLTKRFEIDKIESELLFDIVLTEKNLTLDEVIVQAKRPISIKGDTITFQTKSFAKGNEQNVEDLLKRIPGINIDEEGKIKIGNQEIEKLMIEGDDFFEKGYQLLSKNMPAYPIEEVEVLKNYSNNRLLKDIEESNKVALNLKLNEKSKRVWFGNTELGYGNDGFYEFRTNLMNFGKKNKYFFFTNLNTTGYYTSGDIENVINPTTENSTIGDNQKVQNTIDLSIPRLDFKSNRTNQNDSKSLSLNSIFNITNKVKVKVMGFFNWDKSEFNKSSLDQTTFEDLTFFNSEENTLRNSKNISFGKIDLTYDISRFQALEINTKYNDGTTNSISNLDFNGIETAENLLQTGRLFDQKLSYTNKFQNKKAVLLTARYINDKAPQNYNVNRLFFSDLFNLTQANRAVQENLNKMQFAGVNLKLLDRKENNNLLELEIGNEYRKDRMVTNFSLLENNNVIENPEDFQNDLNYAVNDLYFRANYRLSFKKIDLFGKLSFHQLFNELKNLNENISQKPFFINPKLGLKYSINSNNTISSSYTYNSTNANVLQVFNNNTLTSYRTFSKGFGNFKQLNSSTFFLNYQLGNWANRFFANTILIYNKNHDFFSTRSIIEQNYTQSEKILIKNREYVNINSQIDYYLKKASSNLKFELGYFQSEYKNIVNDSDLRQVRSSNYLYGVQLRTGFRGIVNFHLGTKWTTSKIKTIESSSFTNNNTFLDISFVFNDKFDFEIEGERYHFGNFSKDNTYYFLDFDMRYVVKKDKLTFGLSGKNLFNTLKFRNFLLSDIGSTESTYRLLPRFVLLKTEYRF